MVSAGNRPVLGADKVARLYAGVFRQRAADTVDTVLTPVLVMGALSDSELAKGADE